jgi:hypothetical protein
MQLLGNIIQQIQQRNNVLITDFRKLRKNISIQILLNPLDRNGVNVVFDIIRNPKFQEECKSFENPDDVDVIIDSYGGDADAAYHMAKIIDAHFKGNIKYVVPRFAKSAATLMVCGGNKVVMGETSELGPLDPQIRQDDGSYISAKAVQATLDLIKQHLKEGDKHGLELATILASRINPLVLGQYESSIGIAKEYQRELLSMRMLKDKKSEEVDKIVQRFATGYTHHSRVITCKEAKEIFGEDNIEILASSSPEWNLIWEFYLNNKNIADLLSVLKNIDQFNQK